MFWYILALVLSMLFASAAEKLKGKDDLETAAGTFHYRGSYCCMVVLSFLPFFVVAALRYEVGTDWTIYLDYYRWINDGTTKFTEPLYNLINKFIAWSVNDFQGLIVISAFLVCFFLFKAIYGQSVSIPLSLLIFFVSSSFFASMNQMRQAISMAIVLYAYRYIRDKKPLLYGLWCIVASTIHASALVCLPLYLVAKIKPTVRRYITVFGLVVITLPVLHKLFVELIRHTKYAWYLTSVFNTGNEANNFYLLGFLFQSVMFGIMMFYRFNTEGEDPEYDTMMNSYFLSLLTLLFTPVLSQVLRITQCYNYCQILLIPRVICREKNPARRVWLCILVVGIYTVKLLYDTYILGWNGVLPYQTIFTR